MLTTHMTAIIDDLTRHGEPPPRSLLKSLRAGKMPEEEFRTAMGIRPATPDADAYGEMWKPIPGWNAYDLSNLCRVRTYYTDRRSFDLADTPQRILRGLLVDGLGIRAMTLRRPKRTHMFLADDLLRAAFGAEWEPPPLPDLDPPGVAWRRIPGWPAYEISRHSGMVRSYWTGRRIGQVPRRILRPLWDVALGETCVRLWDGHTWWWKSSVQELVERTWSEPDPGSPVASPPDRNGWRTAASLFPLVLPPKPAGGRPPQQDPGGVREAGTRPRRPGS